ncbi:uncharacterized protein [Argopecten irradians]|uniref:uncharacterized protein n=1 Tax=Argopecten irradians TaxID=31199 RepID=UPI00371116E8
MQLFIFILGICSAFAALDTMASILMAVDHSFVAVDTNQDGLLALDELLESYHHIDFNKDGKISENEFESRSTNHTYTRIVFLELDHDDDGFLDDSSVYGQYAVMDSNGDNIVSRREFDTFYTQVMIDAINKYGFLIGLPPFQQS